MKTYSILALLILALNHSIFSQDFELQYDHTALIVSNFDKSHEFYSGVLGLEEMKVPFNNPLLKWYKFGHNHELHLVLAPEEIKDTAKSMHVALRVDDFDALLKHLKDMDVPYETWTGEANKWAFRPDKIKQIYLQDPDGNWIEINDAGY